MVSQSKQKRGRQSRGTNAKLKDIALHSTPQAVTHTKTTHFRLTTLANGRRGQQVKDIQEDPGPSAGHSGAEILPDRVDQDVDDVERSPNESQREHVTDDHGHFHKKAHYKRNAVCTCT